MKGNLGGGMDGVQAFNVGKADRAISGPRPSSVLSGGICHLGQSTRRKRTSFTRQSMEDLQGSVNSGRLYFLSFFF